MDGLDWKTEYKKEPVAYGVFKIVIGAVVEDEKVSTDDVQEKIEAFEDLVQSVDIVCFNMGICWPLCTHSRFELADDSMPSKGVRMFSSIREFFQRCKCFTISLGRCSST